MEIPKLFNCPGKLRPPSETASVWASEDKTRTILRAGKEEREPVQRGRTESISWLSARSVSSPGQAAPAPSAQVFAKIKSTGLQGTK